MKRRLLLSPLYTCVIVLVSSFAAEEIVPVKIQATSEASGYEAYRAMDGDPQTLWHSEWAGSPDKHPHVITIDLGKSYELSGFTHLPRTDCSNGEIKQYKFFVSQDLKAFGEPVSQGEFPSEHKETEVKLDRPVTGRYVRMVALSESRGQAYGSIGELRILSKGVVFRATS